MNQSKENEFHKYRKLIAALILICGAAPIIFYSVTIGKTSVITPNEAKNLLLAQNGQAVLVDIRPGEDFAASHIDGAVNWPYKEICKVNSPTAVTSKFQNKTLLLICDGGFNAALAAKHLKQSGFADVRNLQGGIQEWIGSAKNQSGGIFERFSSEFGKIWQFPYRDSPFHEQLLAVVSAFAIKPTYTLLSLIIAIMLWKSKAADLTALRWSMICFFIGENFCAANYIFFTDKSYLAEYFHSFGMLLAFAFAVFAVFEGFDSRILMLTDPKYKCAALNLCKRCIKYEDVSCGLRRVFLILIPAIAVIALMPMCAGFSNTSYNTTIFGTFYHYVRRLIYQHFEMQYCPLIAISLLTASFLILAFKKNNPLPWAKVLFAAGIGPLGFGMFRSILTSMYSQNLVWFAFWEEATELIFILGVCSILWIFRKGLFQANSDLQ